METTTAETFWTPLNQQSGYDSQLAPVEGLDAADAERIDATVHSVRAAFAPPVDLETRLDRLDRLESMLRRWEAPLVEALGQDLGKSTTEAWTTELGTVFGEIHHLRRLLPQWMALSKVPGSATLAPSRGWVDHQPLGTVLIIAPWNYPVQLVLSPLAGALAAGNTAVVKPSEVTPHVAQVLTEALQDSLADCVGVVTGAVPETTRVLQHRFDHIFYTGNATVGRVVMRAAAEYLTPVTLELGGKSPVWVDDTVDLKVAAQRIAWGKFLNAGQTCVAPDYVMGPPQVLQRLETLLAAAVTSLYGADPARSDSYGRIVSRRHLDKLATTLSEVATEDMIFGGGTDAEQLYVAPTVVRQAPDGPLMQEEIFGPVLPLVEAADHHQAIQYINAREKPLALYVFSQDDAVRSEFRALTSSGGMCVGAPVIHLAHPHLPFGGVGESGVGNYHGAYSLQTFSHERAVLDKPLNPDTLKVVYPPYTAIKAKGAKIAMGLPSPTAAVRKLFGGGSTRPR
ncbi:MULTISPECIES: aldehyde dehydrogenase family protein [Kocuria]|uniref:Aldehyde dehydrogenase n=1 Tax=Kocuria subflava TaxID=1736139 RepID=A0A846TNZ1_9MICC|nr:MULTISPECIES: aldehyde dehydrogenase family protein [Kocuria]NKE08670.1 aldehyde dehydrogenase family protein [Kocuria subflava]